MLKKALIKVTFKEPLNYFHDMMALLKGCGTRKLFLVHVKNSNNNFTHKKISDKLEELSEKARELGFEVETLIKKGGVASKILEAAKELEVNYIVIYWMRPGIIKQAVLGSPDADILRRSDLPTFVYNRGYIGAGSTKLERVLYATDFKYTDQKVMPYLLNKYFKADTLYLLHVGKRAPDPYTEEARRKKAKDKLQTLAEECQDAYNEIKTLDLVGGIKAQIVAQAKKNNADLIVVGKLDTHNPFKKIMGSTAEVLPNRAKCSVFIIP
ncbi:MAG: universal stress protein [Chlamydiota bacterium]